MHLCEYPNVVVRGLIHVKTVWEKSLMSAHFHRILILLTIYKNRYFKPIANINNSYERRFVS